MLFVAVVDVDVGASKMTWPRRSALDDGVVVGITTIMLDVSVSMLIVSNLAIIWDCCDSCL